MTSGQELFMIRSQKGLTQAKLSDLSGVPQTTISGIENTNKTPGLKTAIKLAKALEIQVEDLLPKEVAK
ncbi:helix-turn-helix transcriptional regulator [Levilactobacillus angrenensis]|jgi:DNA-binding XRE family transcriptional regulator|uniref:helix-turn-helix transcriptional regulator n=1 Tax=Levilactobacillus angrenensis TaxID=2486020 RepID=UPI001CDD737B|nr:helix-turn-helix transcriptional regulator [Levilactobacillus angrenensis]